MQEEFKKRTIIVAADQRKERLDAFLTRQVENSTRTKVQQAIEEDRVLVNGAVMRSSYKVSGNDVIDITFTSPPAPEMKPEDIPIEIVFEDDVLMIINKVAGMTVHPAYGNWTGTLANAVLHHTNKLSTLHEDILRPGIVHRLDKNTSGLIIIAKNNEVHFHIAKQFANREVEKKYVAICLGVPKKTSDSIKTNIGRSIRNRKVMTTYPLASEHGKYSHTEYHVVAEYKYFSILELTLHTGRTHQIRVHLQSIGKPILSDEVYGGTTMSEFPEKKYFLANLTKTISRQALHSKFLSFHHPITHKKLSFECEMPRDMKEALKKIKKLYDSEKSKS